MLLLASVIHSISFLFNLSLNVSILVFNLILCICRTILRSFGHYLLLALATRLLAISNSWVESMRFDPLDLSLSFVSQDGISFNSVIMYIVVCTNNSRPEFFDNNHEFLLGTLVIPMLGAFIYTLNNHQKRSHHNQPFKISAWRKNCTIIHIYKWLRLRWQLFSPFFSSSAWPKAEI